MVCENMASLDLDFPEPESLDKLPLFGAFHFLFSSKLTFLVLPLLCFSSDLFILFPFQNDKTYFIIFFL